MGKNLTRKRSLGQGKCEIKDVLGTTLCPKKTYIEGKKERKGWKNRSSYENIQWSSMDEEL